MSHTADLEGLTEPEARAAEAVDLPWLVDLLSDLIAIRSTGGDEDVIQARVAAELTRGGFEVDAWDIDMDAMRTHPHYSAEIERVTGRGVVGTFGRSDGLHLMLNGHVDVVPVGDERLWSVPPWTATVTSDRVYGRGACDMKGGLACAIAAVRAVREAGIDLTGSVSIAAVIGEEDGGVGTLATLARGHTADAAVVVEPTNGTVAVSQAGALGFRLTVRGRPAHGAVRTEGVSAVEKFSPVLAALQSLERRRNARFSDSLFAAYDLPLALSVGMVRAGEWPSTVPDHLIAEGRYGVAPGEASDTARREFETTIAALASGDPWFAAHPVEVEWWGGQFDSASTSADAAIVKTTQAVHGAIAGTPPPVVGVPYGSDLRHLVNVGGVPSILYGPGDARHAHREDEFVPISELHDVARSLAALVVRFCTTAP